METILHNDQKLSSSLFDQWVKFGSRSGLFRSGISLRCSRRMRNFKVNNNRHLKTKLNCVNQEGGKRKYLISLSFLILATTTTEDPCVRMRAAALPVIDAYYEATILYVEDCVASFPGLEVPDGVTAKMNDCLNTIIDNFSVVVNDIALSLQYDDILWEDVYFETIGITVDSLQCIEVEIRNASTFSGDRQIELRHEAQKIIDG